MPIEEFIEDVNIAEVEPRLRRTWSDSELERNLASSEKLFVPRSSLGRPSWEGDLSPFQDQEELLPTQSADSSMTQLTLDEQTLALADCQFIDSIQPNVDLGKLGFKVGRQF